MTATARAHELAARSLTALPEHRRRTFALRLDRWWDDLIDGLRPVYGDGARRAGRPAGDDRGRGPSRPATTSCTNSTSVGCSNPTGSSDPHMLGYATYAGPVRRRPGRRRRAPRLPDRARGHLPAPDAAAAAPRRRQRRRLRGGRLPVGARRSRHDGRSARHSLAGCGRPGSAWSSTWCSTTSPASTPGRRPPSAGDPQLPRLLLRLPRPHRCRTPTSGPCRRSSRTSRPATSPGTTGPGRLGVDDVQLLAVGRRTGPTPMCSPSTPTSCCSWPTPGSRCCGWTRSRSLWKRLGTDCQNQPEVHAITQALRAVTRIACPAVVFKAEAIVAARAAGAVPRPRAATTARSATSPTTTA